MIDSRSRWLVGSSSSIASGRISRMRASATRIFQPPDSVADVAVHHLLREAEAGQDLARPRLQRVAAQLVEARLHLAEALEQLVHLVGALRIGQRLLQLLQLGGDLGDGAGARHHLGDDRPARHLADVLAEVADGDAALDRDLPVVGRLLAA